MTLVSAICNIGPSRGFAVSCHPEGHFAFYNLCYIAGGEQVSFAPIGCIFLLLYFFLFSVNNSSQQKKTITSELAPFKTHGDYFEFAFNVACSR